MPLAIDFDPYHFACDGELLGIPHFWNVVTNLPFLVVGVWGWLVARRFGGCKNPQAGLWNGVWGSCVLLCATSGWYHWALDKPGLAADRVAICGISGFLLAQALNARGSLARPWRDGLLVALVFQLTVVAWWFGVTSLVYGAFQLVGGLLVLWIHLDARKRGLWTHSLRGLYGMLGCYALAKLVEAFDEPIAHVLQVIGGHPFKHVFAAVGLFCLVPFMRAQLAEAAAREGSDTIPA